MEGAITEINLTSTIRSSFTNVYRFLDIENVLQTGPTLYTQSNLRNLGFLARWAFAQNSAYEIGKTGLTVGTTLQLYANAFDKSGLDANGKPLAPQQSDYSVGFSPFLEYKLTPKVNLRTVTGVLIEHLRSFDESLTFKSGKVYQSFGVGVSITRDIFLYPNVQFIPDQFRPADTNIALSANVNVF